MTPESARPSRRAPRVLPPALTSPCCRPCPQPLPPRLLTASSPPPLTAAPHRRPLTAAHLATRHRAQVRMLDSARWEGIAAEVEPHLPPLLLRVALRESVKADTAPYRRHMVVLSHLEAVTEAKRRLGLQGGRVGCHLSQKMSASDYRSPPAQA